MMKPLSQKQPKEMASFSLTKLEESILKEYRRLSYGEDTPQYEFDSIYYSEIPRQLSSDILGKHDRCLILHNYSLYEMVTFLMFEYLFVHPNSHKKIVINQLKTLICSEDFLFGSHYIKGLLVKGLRIMGDYTGKIDAPIAQLLMKNQCMGAYT